MLRNSFRFVLLILLCEVVSAQMSPLRYPGMGGGQIRLEGYLLPAVTSWPAYPAWSPNGAEIAISMEGHIWRYFISAGGAVQATESPGYDFEPDWSPDGRWLAFSRDVGGNLDIYVVDVLSGNEKRLTEDPAPEFHPRWASDGKIVFAAGSGRGFNILQVDLEGRVEELISSRSDDIQPDPSPAGGAVVFVSDRSQVIGSGGIWIQRAGKATEILSEETTYRTRPVWSPEGKKIAFVSDRSGTNDIWVLPAAGGLPFRLTQDDDFDEFSPTWSPDGKWIAFISNRGGVGHLESISMEGGSTREHRIRAVLRKQPCGKLKVKLSHPARVSVIGSDGRYYAPSDAFRRVVSFTEVHYFHTEGEFEMEVTGGETEIRISHGPEFHNRVERVKVTPGTITEVTLEIPRLVDLPSQGWYSGDSHVHDLHAGDLRLTPAELVAQAEAEDVRVVNALIHMDGTKIMGDPARFVAGPHPASTDRVLLRYGQEYRAPWGHRTFLNLQRMFYPLVSGVSGTALEAPSPPLFDYLEKIRREQPEIIAGVPHPYFGYLAQGELPGRGIPAEIPLNVALGLVDFFDINCIWSDERGSAAIYWKLLNSGFRLAAAGGSDTFSDVWRDPPLGTGRTFVRTEGPLTLDSWYSGLRAAHSFSSNGPILELEVEGRGMGEELQLEEAGTVQIRARAVSAVPMTSLQIISNGEIVAAVEATDQQKILPPGTPEGVEPGWSLEFQGEMKIERSRWIAVQVLGESSPWITDSYLFAHSSPVYVSLQGLPALERADLLYFEQYGLAMIERAKSLTTWDNDAQRDLAVAGFERALAVFRERLGGKR